MDYKNSPQSPGRIFDKIDLPVKIINHYAQRGKFIRGLPSYEQIEGREPNELPDYIMDKYTREIPEVESFPVTNKKKEYEQKAEFYAKGLISDFYKASQNSISIFGRTYMLFGRTQPIRIDAKIGHEKKVLFAKCPSVERIVGLSLYNMLSEQDPIDFTFSEYVFVEEEVRGLHPDEENDKILLKIPRLAESIAKLKVLDDFLSICDFDVYRTPRGSTKKSLVNVMVRTDGTASAFDLDCIFEHTFPPYNLVELFRERGIKIDQGLEHLIRGEEKQRILHAIKVQSSKPYRKLIKMMDQVPYLKERFKGTGFNSAEEFFKFKEAWLLDENVYTGYFK